MNIAVIFFGQPRFFPMTKELIEKEFTFNSNHTVHFYAHFWDRTGYVPEGEETKYDVDKFRSNVINEIPQFNFPKEKKFNNVIIEDYAKLDEACNNIHYFGHKLHDRPLSISNNISFLRYKFGQHYSISRCFKRIKGYETENNLQYDVIIKTRTDIIHKPEEVYDSVEEYNTVKENLYTNLKFDIPYIKCTALRFVDVTDRAKNRDIPTENIHCKEFYNKQYKTEHSSAWMDYPDDNYHNRIAFNDWTLIANRKAAEIIYGNWFENYFLTLSKDIHNNNNDDYMISQSEHALQGQFLLNYNIHANRIYKRRDVRLLHPTIIKKGIDLTGKILAKNKAHIGKELIKRFSGTNR